MEFSVCKFDENKSKGVLKKKKLAAFILPSRQISHTQLFVYLSSVKVFRRDTSEKLKIPNYKLLEKKSKAENNSEVI